MSRSANPDIDGANDLNNLGGANGMGVPEEIDEANVLRGLESDTAENHPDFEHSRGFLIAFDAKSIAFDANSSAFDAENLDP